MTGRDVVIVGAPRSGTNMLRDVLTRLPGFTTWPCDEINAIWRHGNTAHPSDELAPEQARPEVVEFIRSRFDRIGGRSPQVRVVEKTCANSLRVEFVREVAPDAHYVFITRDGLDAAASAMARWHAPFDARYTAAKARFVPLSDVPRYAGRIVARAASRRKPSADGVSTWWGPRTNDYRQLMSSHSLDEICAIQWRRCVDNSLRGFSGLPDDQLHHVSYERFVQDPRAGLQDLLAFLGGSALYDDDAVAGVTGQSVGKGRDALSADARRRLTELTAPTLERLGYVC